MPRIYIGKPTRDDRRVSVRRVASESAQLAVAAFALGSVVLARYDLAAFWVGVLCYVELRKWGRA